MTADEFAFLRRFLRERSGLDLQVERRYLAESRLRPVWRAAGLDSAGALIGRLMQREDGALSQAVLDAMATHETMFFRDRATFETLKSVVLPRLVAARGRVRRLRIWSAAASTGQEAYSVAMLLADLPAPGLSGWQVTILGTDLSEAVLARARTGTYSQFEVQRGLPIRSLLQHFTQGSEGWTVSPALRRAVEFRTFNILDDMRPLGRFDLVLCRNLLIYLDGPTKARLLAKLAGVLAPDGVLCLGATETPHGLSGAFIPDPAARGFSVLNSHQAPALLEATG
ncbi:CheR family methyltransferase [uncultured Enterovirga sp.]|uniref:CheR family methyltransferase n=1 Tax=uncultured Enterovirga sp. TaxID=2026352 RepID=UPI0035CAB402